jgi:predicted amidophosphoribosyltransferase
VLAALVDLIAPPACLACRRPGRGLCAACRDELPWLCDCCERCGLPRPCGPPCPAARAAFERAWAPLAFEGPARALVHALKFRGHGAAARLMAAQMAANAPALEGTLVAVPGRGDHADRLARELARRTDLPLLRALAGGAGRQVGKGRAERRKGPRVEARRALSGPVTLVDDVHTTGATLDACARALRAAGATRVAAVTYARTLG